MAKKPDFTVTVHPSGGGRDQIATLVANSPNARDAVTAMFPEDPRVAGYALFVAAAVPEIVKTIKASNYTVEVI